MPTVTVDNVTLHYQCFGDGENLLLIHGLGANLAFWFPGIASVLSKHYRVIVYDLRGHGRSSMSNSGYTVPHMTQDLEALLEHLGVEQVHVVGHSYGARIGLHYARLHPDRVTTLTLADPKFPCLQSEVRLREWSYWETWKKQLQQQGKPIPSDEEFINFHLLKQLNQSSSESTPDGLQRRASRPTLKKRDMGSKGGAKWEKLMSCTSAKQEFEEAEQITEEDFRKIAIPTLAMYGEQSHCLPSCWKLQELIKDCQVVIIPNAGHFHPVSKPKRFIHTLQQFLKAYLYGSSLPKTLLKESFTPAKLKTAAIEEQRANA